MSWKANVPNKTQSQIASWGLPRNLLLQVYDRLLTTLPRNPDAVLQERIPPLQAFAYRFVLEDSERLPYRHVFFFAVNRDDSTQQLLIAGGSHSTDAPEEN